MAEKKKYKIKDIADKLGTQSKKIAERLAEIGITKSPAGSLDEQNIALPKEGQYLVRGIFGGNAENVFHSGFLRPGCDV